MIYVNKDELYPSLIPFLPSFLDILSPSDTPGKHEKGGTPGNTEREQGKQGTDGQKDLVRNKRNAWPADILSTNRPLSVRVWFLIYSNHI